jgi:hypothetical protein
MKTEVPLKPVPLVNGSGDSLEVCPHCHGTSTHYEAKRYKPSLSHPHLTLGQRRLL